MSIVINRFPEGTVQTGQPVYFFVDCGNTSYTTYKWYLVSGDTTTLISTNSGCTVIFNDVGDFSINLDFQNYPKSWMGGNFYGGTFDGFFGGGTFNYGTLNGNDINNTNINNKVFIEKIK